MFFILQYENNNQNFHVLVHYNKFNYTFDSPIQQLFENFRCAGNNT